MRVLVLPDHLSMEARPLDHPRVWRCGAPLEEEHADPILSQPGRSLLDDFCHSLMPGPCNPPYWGEVRDPLSRWLLRGFETHLIRNNRTSPQEDESLVVHVCAHPRAPFGVLRWILTVSRRTDHDRIFIGRAQTLPLHKTRAWRRDCPLLPILLPHSVVSARSGGPPDMRIQIRLVMDGDLALAAGGERLRLPSRRGQYDRLGLEQKLREIRLYLPHKTDLEVVVADTVLHRDLMDALEIALSTGFSEISLVDRAGGLLRPQPPQE